MESLSTVTEILSQLKELTEGMVSIRQDIDALKLASSFQRNNTQRPGGPGAVDNASEESVPLSNQPSSSGTASNMVVEATSRIPGTTWVEEMEIRDPMSDEFVWYQYRSELASFCRSHSAISSRLLSVANFDAAIRSQRTIKQRPPFGRDDGNTVLQSHKIG